MKTSHILAIALAVAIIGLLYDVCDFNGSKSSAETIRCRQLISQIIGDESITPSHKIDLLMEVRQLIVEKKVDPRSLDMPPYRFNRLLHIITIEVELEKIGGEIKSIREDIRKSEEAQKKNLLTA